MKPLCGVCCAAAAGPLFSLTGIFPAACSPRPDAHPPLLAPRESAARPREACHLGGVQGLVPALQLSPEALTLFPLQLPPG